MDNWERIIKGCVDRNQNQSTLKYIDAVVTRVCDNKFRRVNVKLLTGQEYENMLNKTEEKLAVGQGVKIGYLTIPSKGWIAFANGEANPLGGDGGGIQVESAAIITTAEDFIITQETMIDYSPATKVLYGAAPAFIICQENYMLMSSSWTNTEKALVIANEQYFPDAVHYTGYYYYNNIVHRVEEYFYSYIEQRTWATSGKGERMTRRQHRVDYSYPNNDPTETPILESETDTQIIGDNVKIIKDIGNNTSTLTNYTSDMFMLSRTETIVNKNTLNAALQAFFPEGVDYACHVNTDNGYYNNGWGWISSVADVISSTNITAIVFPFKNRAEQDFSMGVIQRTEPVEVSP